MSGLVFERPSLGFCPIVVPFQHSYNMLTIYKWMIRRKVPRKTVEIYKIEAKLPVRRHLQEDFSEFSIQRSARQLKRSTDSSQPISCMLIEFGKHFVHFELPIRRHLQTKRVMWINQIYMSTWCRSFEMPIEYLRLCEIAVLYFITRLFRFRFCSPNFRFFI